MCLLGNKVFEADLYYGNLAQTLRIAVSDLFFSRGGGAEELRQRELVDSSSTRQDAAMKSLGGRCYGNKRMVTAIMTESGRKIPTELSGTWHA